MKEPTEAFVEQLQRVRLFSAVGQPMGEGVRQARSWFQAMRYCSAQQWEDAQLEAHNQIRDRIRGSDKEAYNAWNTVVVTLRPMITDILSEKVWAYHVTRRICPRFVNSVRWDLIGCCIEKEFADVCATGFCCMLGDIYLSGHFPCGWEGAYPEGTLIVF